MVDKVLGLNLEIAHKNIRPESARSDRGRFNDPLPRLEQTFEHEIMKLYKAELPGMEDGYVLSPDPNKLKIFNNPEAIDKNGSSSIV